MKSDLPLIEVTHQMREGLLNLYLGLPVPHRSVAALLRRKLVEPSDGQHVLTHAGLAYLSAHVAALRVSPQVLELDRRHYHKLGFKYMKHPPHLAQPNPKATTT